MSTLKKTYITLAITVITVFLGASTATAAYKTDVVSDMALIYQGGNHRPEWTEDELRPYVVHTFAEGRMEWFFDSFLFFELADSIRFQLRNTECPKKRLGMVAEQSIRKG